MQTKLTILASAIMGISGVCAWKGHNASGLGFLIFSVLIYVIAFTTKDKKDKQINEIHTAVTRKTENRSIPEKPKNIDEKQIKILSIFIDTNETHIGEAAVMGLSPFNYHETKHLLSSLESLNFIGARVTCDEELKSEYYIKDEGRNFALKKKLV